jgi:hypothetical protein
MLNPGTDLAPYSAHELIELLTERDNSHALLLASSRIQARDMLLNLEAALKDYQPADEAVIANVRRAVGVECITLTDGSTITIGSSYRMDQHRGRSLDIIGVRSGVVLTDDQFAVLAPSLHARDGLFVRVEL